ncbi:hypothetical protein DXT96_24285 [Agrobacterium sp. ICMP 6402]|nr:hypothetical protein [Agrobacterium sp. ICMP 6402]
MGSALPQPTEGTRHIFTHRPKRRTILSSTVRPSGQRCDNGCLHAAMDQRMVSNARPSAGIRQIAMTRFR